MTLYNGSYLGNQSSKCNYAMAEKRPRRRSLRRSEAEAVPPEEPPKKKSKRQSTTLERSKPGKPRNGRASGSLRVKNSASQSPGITESSKQRKKLLVSLNIQDHDLQVLNPINVLYMLKIMTYRCLSQSIYNANTVASDYHVLMTRL